MDHLNASNMDTSYSKNDSCQILSPTYAISCDVSSIAAMAYQGWSNLLYSASGTATEFFEPVISTYMSLDRKVETASTASLSSDESQYQREAFEVSYEILDNPDITMNVVYSNNGAPPHPSTISMDVLGISLMDQIHECSSKDESDSLCENSVQDEESQGSVVESDENVASGDKGSGSHAGDSSAVVLDDRPDTRFQNTQLLPQSILSERDTTKAGTNARSSNLEVPRFVITRNDENTEPSSSSMYEVQDARRKVRRTEKPTNKPPTISSTKDTLGKKRVNSQQQYKKKEISQQNLKQNSASKAQKASSASPFSKHYQGKKKSIATIVDSHEQDENISEEEKRMLGITAEYLRQKDRRNTDLHIICFIERDPRKVIRAIQVCKEMASKANSYNEFPLHYACMNPIWTKLKEREAEITNSVVSGISQSQKALEKRLKRHRLWGKAMKELIAAYPPAAREENMDRCVPLHLYCLMGAPCTDALEAMIQEYPEATVLQSEFSIPFNTTKQRQKSRSGDAPKKSRLLQVETPRNATTISSDNPSSTKRNLLSFYLKRDSFLQATSTTGRQPPSRGLHRIEKGKAVPPQSKDVEVGWTPLHIAAVNVNSVESLRSLIRVGPTGWHIKTSQGRSPLDCAISSNAHQEIIDVLKKYCSPLDVH